MVAIQKPKGRMRVIHTRALIFAAIIGLVSFILSAKAQSSNTVTTPENTTLLSIVVQGMPSQTAPLRWSLYGSKDALPGIFSRGKPYRKGVSDPFDDPAIIDVGEVPEGFYFAIVAQDIDLSKDIAKFSEPRGYSGYDGCSLPSWRKGAQSVNGEQAVIEVVLQCNMSSWDPTDAG